MKNDELAIHDRVAGPDARQHLHDGNYFLSDSVCVQCGGVALGCVCASHLEYTLLQRERFSTQNDADKRDRIEKLKGKNALPQCQAGKRLSRWA